MELGRDDKTTGDTSKLNPVSKRSSLAGKQLWLAVKVVFMRKNLRIENFSSDFPTPFPVKSECEKKFTLDYCAALELCFRARCMQVTLFPTVCRHRLAPHRGAAHMSGRAPTPTQHLMADLVSLTVRTARNGAVYGAKVRFLHALVISLLYRRGSLKARILLTIRSTALHARTLAVFAAVYRLAYLAALRLPAWPRSGVLPALAKFLAGSVAGYIVYLQLHLLFVGPIGHQITLYCFLRVVVALGKVLVEKLPSPHHRKKSYAFGWRVFSVLTWGLVMALYDTHPNLLQSLLRHSMDYIYRVDNAPYTLREFLGV